MKRKFTARIVAVLSAVVMAVSTMAINAGAISWSVYRQNRGNGTYSTYATYKGYLRDPDNAHTTCKVNCTSFYTDRPANKPAAHAEYWTYISTTATGDAIALGFARQGCYNTFGYKTFDLETKVGRGYYLRCNVELMNYNNVNNCSMSGNFTW